MKRLSIALSVLLSFNLLTIGLRWLMSAQILPLADLWLVVFICVGILALTYFTTLEASPDYALYQREARVYAVAGLVGLFLGLFF